MKTFLTVISVALIGILKCEADEAAAVDIKLHNYSPDPRLLIQRLLGTFSLDVDLVEVFKDKNADGVTLSLIINTEHGEFISNKTYERGATQSDPISFTIPEEDFDLVTLVFTVGFGFHGDLTSYKLSDLYPPRNTEQPTEQGATGKGFQPSPAL
jgi:hypothetical protein